MVADRNTLLYFSQQRPVSLALGVVVIVGDHCTIKFLSVTKGQTKHHTAYNSQVLVSPMSPFCLSVIVWVLFSKALKAAHVFVRCQVSWPHCLNSFVRTSDSNSASSGATQDRCSHHVSFPTTSEAACKEVSKSWDLACSPSCYTCSQSSKKHNQ